MTKEKRSYRGKTVSEQWRHQALVNAWSSSIDARRQYILQVYIVRRQSETICATRSLLRAGFCSCTSLIRGRQVAYSLAD